MASIPFLLDSFIKLADRIINLEKSKLQDRQILFNEIVKPLYDELGPVASNYMEIFRNAKITVNNCSQSGLRDVIILIREERQVMWMARTKVRKMAFQIREIIEDDEIGKFAGAVNDFFSSATGEKATLTSSFIEFLEHPDGTHGNKAEISDYINSTLADLEESWGSIVQTYGKLMILSVSPKRYIRPKKK